MHPIRAAPTAAHLGADPGSGGARARHVAPDLSPDRNRRAAYSFRRTREDLRGLQLPHRRIGARRATRQHLYLCGKGDPRRGAAVTCGGAVAATVLREEMAGLREGVAGLREGMAGANSAAIPLPFPLPAVQKFRCRLTWRSCPSY